MAAQAGPLAQAKARQQVVVEEVRVEKMRTQEQIAVQEQEVQRKQKELEATVIKSAEADRQAAILRAEAAKQSAILEAEGTKSAQIALAEAQQEKLRQEGMGRAAAVEAEGRAEAAKIEAVGLAQARAIEAQGVAEAQAILKKAEAWKQFSDAAKLQTILEKLPAVLEASAGIFGAVAAPLGNIDKVVVIEQGNGGDSPHRASSHIRTAATIAGARPRHSYCSCAARGKRRKTDRSGGEAGGTQGWQAADITKRRRTPVLASFFLTRKNQQYPCQPIFVEKRISCCTTATRRGRNFRVH